jgi:2'-5' RNA ligase
MLASIWLRLANEQEASLGALIERLALAQGTASFQPHLAVCSAQSEASWDAATEYVRKGTVLPLRVGRKLISFSTTEPMRAVVIDVENTPDLNMFREDLRRITGAAEPPPPHISLLYAVNEAGQQPSWSSNERTLKSIAEECERYLDEREFVLDRPVIVAPDRAWINIKSWRVVRIL